MRLSVCLHCLVGPPVAEFINVSSPMDTITALKNKGKVAFHSGQYSEAWKYYTEALNMLVQKFGANQNNGVKINVFIKDSFQESKLYSKRSMALLKLNQFYYAFEDAKQITNITPEWFKGKDSILDTILLIFLNLKGYLRKANIELQCGLFEKSLRDYQLALRYVDREQNEEKRKQHEKHINQSIKHVLFLMQREKIFDYQIPWIGAALGLVVGMAIVTWDYVSHHSRSYISHPIWKLFVIGLVSFIFFYLANMQRNFGRKQKEQLLMPPYGKESSSASSSSDDKKES